MCTTSSPATGVAAELLLRRFRASLACRRADALSSRSCSRLFAALALPFCSETSSGASESVSLGGTSAATAAVLRVDTMCGAAALAKGGFSRHYLQSEDLQSRRDDWWQNSGLLLRHRLAQSLTGRSDNRHSFASDCHVPSSQPTRSCERGTH